MELADTNPRILIKNSNSRIAKRKRKLKKSSSFRGGGGEREEDGGRGAKSDPKCSDSLSSLAKSPKLSRTESMTERTVQKITKVIRGTSRFVSFTELSYSLPLSCVAGRSRDQKRTEIQALVQKEAQALLARMPIRKKTKKPQKKPRRPKLAN